MLNFLKRKQQTETENMQCCEATLSLAEQIGATAGKVWQTLDQQGELKIGVLVKQVDASRDEVMQAIGWLARENKIQISVQKKTRLVSLVSHNRQSCAA